MAFALPEDIISNFSIDEGMHVADFGAGSGAYSIMAGRLAGSSGRVYAIDVNKDILSKVKADGVKQKVFSIEIVWGDIEVLGGTKLASKILDRVIISNVLFQVGDKEGVVKEAGRLLKPGGLALVVDWSGSYGGLGPKEGSVLSKDAALKLFLNNGFVLVREISAGDYHFGFIVRRI